MNIELNVAELQMLISAMRQRVKLSFSHLKNNESKLLDNGTKEKTEAKYNKTVELYNKLQLELIKSEAKTSDN